MQLRTLLIACTLATGTSLASADVLVGQTPIGLTGTFTIELTGCPTTTTSSNAKYVKNTVTGVVTLRLPALTCNSSAVTTQLINLPPEIIPAAYADIAVIVQQGVRFVPGWIRLSLDQTYLDMAYFTGSAMSASFPVGQVKGLNNIMITYQGYPDT